MNLVVDAGNTRIKLGFFENKNLLQHFVFNHIQEIDANEVLKKYFEKVKYVIVSNVTEVEIDIFFRKYLSNASILNFSTLKNFPLQIDYKTPHTLGQDRIACAAGAIKEFQDTNILVIDLGTCIKYNVINNKTFVGGAISPGLQMRYKALHHFTGKLPLLDFNENISLHIIGKDTQENLHSGVINGCVAEINYFIDNITGDADNWVIVLTGGDALFFEKVIKRKVFLRPYLILNGLNEILEYQIGR